MEDLRDVVSGIVIPAVIAVVGWLFAFVERRGANRMVNDIKATAEALRALGPHDAATRVALEQRMTIDTDALARRNDPTRTVRIAWRLGSVLVGLLMLIYLARDFVISLQLGDQSALRFTLYVLILVPLASVIVRSWNSFGTDENRRVASPDKS